MNSKQFVLTQIENVHLLGNPTSKVTRLQIFLPKSWSNSMNQNGYVSAVVYGIRHNVGNWLKPITKSKCKISVFPVLEELDFMEIATRDKNVLFWLF